MGAQPAVVGEAPRHGVVADGLEHVVDRVGLERLEDELVVGGREDRRAGDDTLAEQLERQAVGEVFALSFLCSLVLAFNLAAFLGAKATLAFGTFAGLATGLGWVAMSLAIIYLFEQRSF
ncbi:MAG: DUF1761 domain-containing protein, partial [Caldimonas sp.]